MTGSVRPLLSGGAVLAINGVDRIFPHWRAALDELEAVRTVRDSTIDYPADAPGGLDKS